MTVLISTRTRVIDNSGGIVGECVEIYKASKYYGADVGDLILVALKRAVPNKKVRKGDLIKAIIVRSRTSFIRYSAHRIRLSENALILVNNNSLAPRAKRARSLIMEEVRKSKESGLKVLAIAPIVM